MKTSSMQATGDAQVLGNVFMQVINCGYSRFAVILLFTDNHFFQLEYQYTYLICIVFIHSFLLYITQELS